MAKTCLFHLFSWVCLYETLCNTGLITLIFSCLAKCHDDEICFGCKKESSISLYENGLQCKLDDVELEIFARMRLVETYYKSNQPNVTKQLDLVEPLLDSMADSAEKKSKSADLYYYRGNVYKNNLFLQCAIYSLITHYFAFFRFTILT